MEFNSNQPIYMQIIRLVENRLINQEWQAGQKVPSVREFALELRVNPNTIQRAYMELERQGLIFSKRGMGNFVTEDTQKITSLFNTIAQTVFYNLYQIFETFIEN